MWYQGILDRDLVPDWVIRQAIRRRCQARLDQEQSRQDRDRFVADLQQSPIALHTDLANEQHYEVPPAFFQQVLGPRRKYSCGLWPDGVETLAGSEDAMLALTCERAELQDGQRILDLGCGWGSLALYAAERFPGSEIVAVSNSRDQGEFTRAEAASLGLQNLAVHTADVNDFAPEGRFDRVVSVEMFEHLKNYGEMLARIAGWLAPDGRLFVHMFVHRELAYHYESEGPDDWMARHFFTGGTMPSHDLLRRFDAHLTVAREWQVSGLHYQRTLEAWLANMDRRREAVRPILAATYGEDQVTRWWVRWRVFFMACSELFGYRGGQEWFVGHYRLRPTGS
ncbi:methyltransferase domain-containing protein [bacterium]|nr:methyltransferase domain-containing protein [bacterium]